MTITDAMIEEFTDVWSEMDPRATRFINARNIEQLLKGLSPPLGVKGLDEHDGLKKEMQRIVLTSKIPCHPGGYVQFHETLHGLAARAAFVPLDEDDEQNEMRKEEMEMEMIRLMPSLAYRNIMGPTPYDAGHFMAAMYVQSAIRGFLARHAPPKSIDKPAEPEPQMSGSRRIMNGIAGLAKQLSMQLNNFGINMSRRMGSMSGGQQERSSGVDQGLPPELARRMQESIRRGSSFANYADGEPSVRAGSVGASLVRQSETGSTGSMQMSVGGMKRLSLDPNGGSVAGAGKRGSIESVAENGSVGGEKPQLSRRLSRLWAAS